MTLAILIVTVALVGWLLIYMFSQKPATSAQELIQRAGVQRLEDAFLKLSEVRS